MRSHPFDFVRSKAATCWRVRVGAMQFTYTFPPLLRFGYDVIKDAMAADALYVPGQGARGRVDKIGRAHV